MALIIKGEMPTSCRSCNLDCLQYQEFNNWEHERYSKCSKILGEIPDNHGKLKDYDKIKEVLTKNFDVNADSLVYYILCLIDETDTVLEASTSEGEETT